ncbi:hypothetical protein HDU76_005992 [Blyttiomyces sp. JEL0837]|nr:hypothetical protein HDU76_005992 [Blyttiomyces sp. JEL0837]
MTASLTENHFYQCAALFPSLNLPSSHINAPAQSAEVLESSRKVAVDWYRIPGYHLHPNVSSPVCVAGWRTVRSRNRRTIGAGISAIYNA